MQKKQTVSMKYALQRIKPWQHKSHKEATSLFGMRPISANDHTAFSAFLKKHNLQAARYLTGTQ